ncbi:hypothetical protein NQ152_15815 [Microbacterium sp. zg.B48]|uniref:hypothetical protein n=1 Tax=Microbacterium sp. zg.B48 TaxID=2969408 RepID=UPI00214B8ECC|nr:hypothetical protein [Microbacterium sp. zg.B48]MCR2764973.1 hypothetical protein [Microbacterium sp. zg.B48]
MKVDVKTLDGKAMTADAADTLVGTALRIAPGFVATALDEDAGIETTIEARYNAAKVRYIPSTVITRAVDGELDASRVGHTLAQATLQAAVPHCVAVRLDDGSDARWLTVADLTTGEGRIIPPWMASTVVKRGMKDERWDVVEILYGAATLAGSPPVKLISLELDVPQRTAEDWIRKARDSGRLVGMTAHVGRPASG